MFLDRLQKLNQYTKVIYHNDKIKPDDINNTQCSVAIFCDMSLVKLGRRNVFPAPTQFIVIVDIVTMNNVLVTKNVN